MKKSLLFLTLVLGMTLIVGSAFADEELGDDGQPVGLSVGSLSFGSQSGGRPQGSLTTTFAGGNGYAGNMFDIVPSFDMMIDAIDVNIDAVGETAQIDVYWKDGTCVGFETSPADWTLLGNFTGVGAGDGNPTFIDMYGNGKTFLSGQTYGIYVDLVNYSTITGNMNFTNGAPTVYSNADLTLTTWCGMTTPAFNSYFADRMWNGTIYYDDPHALEPRTIIRANGSTEPQTVFDFENVQVDIQVDAFSGAGIDCEIWVLLKSKFGKLTYDGAGPHSGWWRDLKHPYFQGPLADVTDTVLNQLLPAGDYTFFLALDRVMDGVPNKADVFKYTSVDVTVNPFTQTPMKEDFDDGVADNWIDDGPHWSVPVDTYYLDCPSFADFVSYYDGSPYADFTYTADMMQVTTGNPSMTYDFGMFFRSDGTLSNCYEFYAEPDGSVYLYVRPGSVLYSNTLSTNWIVGHDVWNTVSIDNRGSTIDLYINGVLETSVTDSTYTWGYVGLSGQGSGTYDQDFQFDNVSVTL
jgi:hypothetical protein